METYISKSEKETEKYAAKLAKTISEPTVIALIGDLGSGKTAFSRGFAKGLKIKDKIKSPTFVLYKKYELKDKDLSFYHFDLYRLNDSQDVAGLGLDEILDDKAIVLIEWADKILDLLPNNTKILKIEHLSDESRKITVE